MISDPLSKRRLLARIAIAFVVPWLPVLTGLRLFGSSLIVAGFPIWTGTILIQTTGGLIVLSIVIVPLVAWFHARLCWRDNYALRAYISVGSITTSLATLALFVVSELVHSAVHFFLFLRVFAIPLLYATVVCALIGAIASWSAWFLPIRPLRVQAGEVLSRFD
jgi:hypothetical protein